MIAWMQNWDTCNLHTKSIPWFGQMTLPRELSIKDGRLYQWPIRELLSMRRDEVHYENVRVKDDEIELDGVRGRLVDMEVELKVVEERLTASSPARGGRSSIREELTQNRKTAY